MIIIYSLRWFGPVMTTWAAVIGVRHVYRVRRDVSDMKMMAIVIGIGGDDVCKTRVVDPIAQLECAAR